MKETLIALVKNVLADPRGRSINLADRASRLLLTVQKNGHVPVSVSWPDSFCGFGEAEEDIDKAVDLFLSQWNKQ